MTLRRLIRLMAFVLILSSVLSSEAVEAWRRDLAAAAPARHAPVPVCRPGASAKPARGPTRRAWDQAGVVAVSDDDFVDIPSFSAPTPARTDPASGPDALPGPSGSWSAPALPAVTLLTDLPGPSLSPPPPGSPGLRAPPCS